MIRAFERAKTIRALDRAGTVIGSLSYMRIQILGGNVASLPALYLLLYILLNFIKWLRGLRDLGIKD
jgi:hypothetical protein